MRYTRSVGAETRVRAGRGLTIASLSNRERSEIHREIRHGSLVKPEGWGGDAENPVRHVSVSVAIAGLSLSLSLSLARARGCCSRTRASHANWTTVRFRVGGHAARGARSSELRGKPGPRRVVKGYGFASGTRLAYDYTAAADAT